MHGCNADNNLNDAEFSKPLPWIGLYIAAASLLCAFAVAADAIRGFRCRKLWFPSKYFSLNATTLTLLGIATKLPVDLNTSMPRSQDQLTKLSGTVLICTLISNFLPSIGAMDGSDIVSNIVALGILVITVIVNVCIQMRTGVIYVFLPEHALIMFFMLILLVILVSSALTVQTTKNLLEKQFDAKYNQVADESKSDNDKYAPNRLKEYAKKFWLMAHTCSPQYVIGRSATCTASGALCLLCSLILVEATVRSFIQSSMFCAGDCDYQWSTMLVFIAQAITVVLGTTAPAFRWFNAVSFRSSEDGRWSCKEEFKVEKFWLQRLKEWKEAPLSFHITWRWKRKISHDSRNLILTMLLGVQVGVVRMSKLVRLVSFFPVSCFNQLKKFVPGLGTSNDENGDHDLSNFVLHLDGESGLVNLILKSGRKDTERWIERGKKNEPTDLINLIKNHSDGFNGVGQFDSSIVSSLISEEPPNCWALPVVTLASIAVAIPNIDKGSVESLLKGVYEGLYYIRLVEKNLDDQGLVKMRDAADIVWLGVDLYHKWLNEDLHRLVPGEGNCRKIVEELREIGKKRVAEYKRRIDMEEENVSSPPEWPKKVLAANCMYRVTATILQNHKMKTNEQLFSWLRKTIADILGACLTNLPQAIYMQCFCHEIEVREQRVRDAALTLGKAERILQQLENIPRLPERKEYIDEWREMLQDTDAP